MKSVLQRVCDEECVMKNVCWKCVMKRVCDEEWYIKKDMWRIEKDVWRVTEKYDVCPGRQSSGFCSKAEINIYIGI